MILNVMLLDFFYFTGMNGVPGSSGGTFSDNVGHVTFVKSSSWTIVHTCSGLIGFYLVVVGMPSMLV